MLRKMMIALFAVASVAVLAPDTASARGGWRRWWFPRRWRLSGGGGGFRGGGGFGGGGFRGGGLEWAAVASAQPQSAAAVSVQLRSVALVSVRWHSHRPDFVAALLPSTVFAAASTPGSGIGDSRLAAVGVGLGYGLYGYGYDDYYGYGVRLWLRRLLLLWRQRLLHRSAERADAVWLAHSAGAGVRLTRDVRSHGRQQNRPSHFRELVLELSRDLRGSDAESVECFEAKITAG